MFASVVWVFLFVLVGFCVDNWCCVVAVVVCCFVLLSCLFCFGFGLLLWLFCSVLADLCLFWVCVCSLSVFSSGFVCVSCLVCLCVVLDVSVFCFVTAFVFVFVFVVMLVSLRALFVLSVPAYCVVAVLIVVIVFVLACC